MALGMIGGIFGIHGDGRLDCMDKVVGVAGHSRRQTRRSAGAEYFARRSYWRAPTGLSDDEAICAQVGCTVKLIIAGLQEDDLRQMDDQDRSLALEQAGLDPEEYAYLAV